MLFEISALTARAGDDVVPPRLSLRRYAEHRLARLIVPGQPLVGLRRDLDGADSARIIGADGEAHAGSLSPLILAHLPDKTNTQSGHLACTAAARSASRI